MSKPTYRRPAIERARLANPEREAPNRTELEDEIGRIAREREPQQRRAFAISHYQYDAPFNYPNFRVELGRPWENAANQAQPDAPEEEWGTWDDKTADKYKPGYVGAEVNPDGVELDVPPYGAITFEDEEPIVEVTVIGSACVPPGYVLLFGEPCEWQYMRTGVKMRADNLWGEHLRHHLWYKGSTRDTATPA